MAEEYLQKSSINPASGHYIGIDFSKPMEKPYENSPSKKAFAIPESLSSASGGIPQQTFLGASIVSFSINAGFGDSTSTMNIDLVEDEFNVLDKTPLGTGVDHYHNGKRDTFNPPFTGAPVYFNFGKQRASVNDSYKKMYDDLYGMNYAASVQSSGQFNFNFGGILQSFTQNRGPNGNPLYSAQVVDPREILSNAVLILNNYTGTTYNNKNMFNLYGFLEYNPTPGLKIDLNNHYPIKDELRKTVAPNGSYVFSGYDLYSQYPNFLNYYGFYNNSFQYNLTGGYPPQFPITGTGYSRRGPNGIPFYRIRQALSALLSVDGKLPQEYINAGFGGYINFRGYNYLIDLSGLKTVPDYYFFDFDQINILDFCLEICDITSSDLFVSLLPIIEHPVCQRFYEYNKQKTLERKFSETIAGIIRVDSIDRSFQPEYGAIKKYIDRLNTAGVYVTNQDLGYELSNVVTDKFVAGAQKVDMHFFSSINDRDTIEVTKQQHGIPNISKNLLSSQWTFEQSLSQQILPYYGLLGDQCVTIPKGFGAYQQILLDSSSWKVFGVGNYYVATEIELRSALISYEKWSDFLIRYNDLYMESVEENDAVEGAALQGTPASLAQGLLSQFGLALGALGLGGLVNKANEFFAPPISKNYAVTVPRSVFTSNDNRYGIDGLPVNSCNPPYGYPLYYKRATRLGIQGAGLTDIQASTTRVLTSLAKLRGSLQDGVLFQETLNTEFNDANSISEGKVTGIEAGYIRLLEFLRNLGGNIPREDVLGMIDKFSDGAATIVSVQNRLSKKTVENSLKVYNYIRKIADENLGKKFLVKIPREVNLFFDRQIKYNEDTYSYLVSGVDVDDNGKPIDGPPIKRSQTISTDYKTGPFGFKPRSINNDPNYENSPFFKQTLFQEQVLRDPSVSLMKGFLTPLKPNPTSFHGALETNFNPVLDKYEFNYEPDKQGGYVDFDFGTSLTQQNLAIRQGLVPIDLTNFINENSRLSAYVRFNNSQDLSFDLLGEDTFSQQAIYGQYFIPDVCEILDNTNPENNKFERFPNSDDLAGRPRKTPSIGFVKCDVDENFYFSPSFRNTNIRVHGASVIDIGELAPPRKVFNNDTCEFEPSLTYYKSHFIPVYGPGPIVQRLDVVRNIYGNIRSDTSALDPNNIYALITLPGRVLPTVDARFRDGIFQEKNPQMLKHYMSMDVVKIPEFISPAFLGNPKTSILKDYKNSLDPTATSNAIKAYNKVLETLSFASPENQIQAVMPSPVYPDLVALPLRSKDRCYGPWVSSTFSRNASNIGGKIEFIKEETLAPWNYSGYDLMNEMGFLQADLSNSLLLSTERGGLTIPDAPSGIAIAKFLQNAGPLITNISVDVSSNQINTTIKMDMYTASFGKLQKQKQDLISNISRERQKNKDERNALIRKGLGKNQTNVNFNIIYEQLKSAKIEAASLYKNNNGNNGALTSFMSKATSIASNAIITNSFGTVLGGVAPNIISTAVSLVDPKLIPDIIGNASERLQASLSHYSSAHGNIGDMFTPATMDSLHPYMPGRQDAHPESRTLPYQDVDGFPSDEISTYQ